MDTYIILYLLFASGFHFIRAKTSQSFGVPCHSKPKDAVKFTVSSHPDSTGHSYGVSQDPKKNAGNKSWLAQVKDDTRVCGGVEFLRTTSTITYSPRGLATDSARCPAPLPCPTLTSSGCLPSATCHAPKAGSGYEFYPGFGYFKFHAEVKAWREARKICYMEGGHLAIVNSEAESALLVRIFSGASYVTPYVLIGFHDMHEEGQHRTLFDETFRAAGFTRWDSGQPDNQGGQESCGSINRNNGGLNDMNCNTPTQFICEYMAQ